MSKAKESHENRTRQHIREMKEQLQHLCGKNGFVFEGNFANAKQEEAFLKQILIMEEAEEQPLFDILEKGGLQLPPPASLNETQLHVKLWEVINSMALLGCYLSSTDHLSDRQLYEVLWDEILREPTSVSPGDPNSAWHIDILGGCSEEDLQTRLKYYADEYDRISWAEEFPDEILPPHESLPYDRDQYLPAAPFMYSSKRDVC
jgi:hypothetical protein